MSQGTSELSAKLGRRAFLGLGVEAVGASGGPGVRVVGVSAVGPTARAGLRTGDLLLAAQGAPIHDAASLRKEAEKVRPGERFELAVARGEEVFTTTIVVGERPLESYQDLDVLYDAVEFRGAKLRTILTTPRAAARPPVVMYLQGYSSESVDCGMPGLNRLRDLVAALGRAGCAVLRVEKPGVGDSEGAPCQESGFLDETEAFAAALPYFERCERLEGASCLALFGHSMGGLQAAMIGGRSKAICGVAVYGSIGRPYAEYEADNLQRQMRLAGAGQPVIEERWRRLGQLQDLLYREQRRLQDILERHPDLVAERGLYGIEGEGTLRGRHPRYWQEVERTPIVRSFADLDLPLLAAWGEADYRASRADHESIAEAVNRGHAGRGTFQIVKASDHGFARFASQEESFRARGQGGFNPEIVAALCGWIRALPR